MSRDNRSAVGIVDPAWVPMHRKATLRTVIRYPEVRGSEWCVDLGPAFERIVTTGAWWFGQRPRLIVNPAS